MTDPVGRPLYVLLGAVGAGKGTQAAALADDRGLLHLSTGDLFRRAIREGSPLGEVAQGYMRRGELVPDEITIRMVAEALREPRAAGGVVFDGFPRTGAQAEALDQLLAETGERVAHAILIEVPEDALVSRVAGRWVCPQCGTPYHITDDPPTTAGVCNKDGTALVQRDDDKPDVFRARLREQIPPMEDVMAHYTASGRLTRVDGHGTISAVAGAVRSALRESSEV